MSQVPSEAHMSSGSVEQEAPVPDYLEPSEDDGIEKRIEKACNALRSHCFGGNTAAAARYYGIQDRYQTLRHRVRGIHQSAKTAHTSSTLR